MRTIVCFTPWRCYNRARYFFTLARLPKFSVPLQRRHTNYLSFPSSSLDGTRLFSHQLFSYVVMSWRPHGIYQQARSIFYAIRNAPCLIDLERKWQTAQDLRTSRTELDAQTPIMAGESAAIQKIAGL